MAGFTFDQFGRMIPQQGKAPTGATKPFKRGQPMQPRQPMQADGFAPFRQSLAMQQAPQQNQLGQTLAQDQINAVVSSIFGGQGAVTPQQQPSSLGQALAPQQPYVAPTMNAQVLAAREAEMANVFGQMAALQGQIAAQPNAALASVGQAAGPTPQQQEELRRLQAQMEQFRQMQESQRQFEAQRMPTGSPAAPPSAPAQQPIPFGIGKGSK